MNSLRTCESLHSFASAFTDGRTDIAMTNMAAREVQHRLLSQFQLRNPLPQSSRKWSIIPPKTKITMAKIHI